VASESGERESAVPIRANPPTSADKRTSAGSPTSADPQTLADLTTLRIGGPVDQLIVARDADSIIDAVRGADADGTPLLLVGGGSNLVGGDEGWPGLVVQIESRGVRVEPDHDDVLLDLAAGEPWDAAVELAVSNGWRGIESLSGIPGLAGATPVQNVGAYGADIASVLEHVQVWDRTEQVERIWPAAAVGLGYRDSAFKHTDRYVVLEVRLRLHRSQESEPVRYAQLAAALGVPIGARAPLHQVRRQVLDLRRAKGMVLDAGDHDTWSVGSFFTNPIVAQLPDRLIAAGVPESAYWPATGGTKLSAAWLIQSAGFGPGFALPGSGAAVSGKHTLALTNRGGATGAQVRELAAAIVTGVRVRLGVDLVPEPRIL
jgi:UDP-N-acetylmuramate dehydrogenase